MVNIVVTIILVNIEITIIFEFENMKWYSAFLSEKHFVTENFEIPPKKKTKWWRYEILHSPSYITSSLYQNKAEKYIRLLCK